MDDQSTQNHKVQLSLEEELDVLEAVYKIGMEKGLELLTPLQKKKLSEANRITIETETDVEVTKLTHEEAIKIAFDTAMATFSTVDSLVPLVKDGKQLADFPKSEWIAVRSEVFDTYFGITFDEFGKQIYQSLVS